MKQKYYLIIGIITLALIITLILTKQQTPKEYTCEELQINFDNSNVPSPDGCDEWEKKGRKSIWVGGVLTNISTHISFDYYSHALTFKGKEEQREVYIATGNETIPYKINQFYKFDIAESCYTLRSAVYSGAILDRNLTALKPVDCKIGE